MTHGLSWRFAGFNLSREEGIEVSRRCKDHFWQPSNSCIVDEAVVVTLGLLVENARTTFHVWDLDLLCLDLRSLP